MASSQILKLLAQQQVQNYLNQQQQAMFTPPEVSEDEIAKYQADFDSWKASQSKPKSAPKYESAEIPQLLPQFQGGYVAQNDARRSYKGNSALETLKANKEYLEQNNGSKNEPKEQIKQLDWSGYDFRTSPSEDFMAQVAQKEAEDKQREMDVAKMRVWLNPSFKMTKEQEKEANQIANKYLSDYRGVKKSDLTPEQREEVQTLNDIKAKTNDLYSFTIGAGKRAISTAQNLGNLLLTAGQANAPNSQALDIQRKNIQDYRNKVKETNAGFDDVVQNVKNQNPLAYKGGQTAEQIFEYMLTNGAFETAGLAGEGASRLAQFGATQIGENAQDLVLDTLPLYMNIAEDPNYTSEEKAKMISDNILSNAAGNAVAFGLFTGLMKWLPEDIGKMVRKNIEDKTAKEAFTQNISEGAEKLAKLNEQGYVPPQRPTVEEIAALNTNPLEADNKQFNALMDQFNNEFKDDSAMRNIFTPEDLEASQNSQFTELMKQRPKTINDLAPDEIPEINTELPDIPSLKDVDDYSNMWKSADEIPNIAENAQKPSIKERFGYIDLPEEVSEKGASDFAEIYDSLENMRKVAEASGDEKVMAKFNKLSKAVNDYEDAFFKEESEETLTSAKKAADAARQSFIREVKKTNPNYTGELTGTKLGNAAYRRTSMKPDEQATQELVDSIIETEKELGDNNRWVRDAVPETQNPFKGVEEDLVMAEDIGLNPKTDIEEPKFKIEEIDEAQAPKGGESITDSTKVNERGQSRHIRNTDTPMKMEGVSDEVVADFEDNPDLYTVLKNADTKAKAEKIYNTSDNPEVQFRDMLRAKDPAALPLGHQLAKDYSAAGNHEAAAQIYREMGEELTKAGQFSQAAVINMMKNDPLTALQYAQRQVDQLNKAGADKFGKKWKDFSLTQDEINAFNKIEPGDADAIAKVFDDIGVRIGKEYPTTLLEKGLELRRIAMLFNSRTMIRNTAANIPTRYMRKFSDRLEAVGQNIVHLIDPEFKVTQSLTGGGKEGRKVATEVWNSPIVQNMLKDSPGKYELPSLKNSLINNKQMFKGTPVDRFLDKYSGDAFNKIAKILGKDVEIDGGIKALNSKLFGKKDVDSVIETVRNATYKALDMGDSPFVKGNFIDRLSSYIKAQGYKSADEVPEEAIQTAWEEAMKATYKDDSWAVHVTQGVKNAIGHVPGVGKPFADALIPFVQAPSNIAARMVDYSPIRGTKGVADIFMGATKSNPKQITRGIEELSKGLTGTAATYLGYKLYEAGILTGAYSEDKDQKAFEKQNGFREFALRYGPNKYYTINWMQPGFQSIMSGVIIADAIKNADEYDSMLLKALGHEGTTAGKAIGVGKAIGKGTFNSWFDQSTMQSIQELFSGNYSNGTDIAGNIANIGVNDFVGSFVPSSINAVAKTADTTQRNTYDKSNIINNFVNQQKAKIPGLSQDLPAKYDTWGEEMKYADNNLEAAFNRFINPGEGTTDTSDDIDKEITRLFEEAKDSEGKLINDAGVFPQVAPYKVGEKQLNNEEVSQYQEDMGKRSRTLVESFMNSDAYKDMSDIDRIENIKNLYGLSKQLTEKSLFDKEIADSSEYKKPIEAYEEAGGGEKGAEAVLNYYAGKKIIADAGLSSSSNAAKEVAAAVAEGNMEEAQTLADNAAKTKEILDKYGVSNTSNAGKDVKAAVEAGNYSKAEKIAADAQKAKEEKAAKEETKAESSDELSSYGLTKPGPSATYQKAKGEIPGLTTQQFASTYKLIDSDGNQGIKQQELLDYLNKYVTSETKAQEIWSAYGGWKNKKGEYKKLIKNKDGSWGSSY